jgi:membrane protease YdiL (CAAX protease family)
VDFVEPTIIQPTCNACGNVVRETDTFCGSCGREIKPAAPAPREDVFESLRLTLLYYFTTIILLIIYKMTPAFEPGFEGLVFISIIDIVIVLAFWIYCASELAPLFSLKKIKGSILGLTVIGAIAGAFLISFIGSLINLSINDDVFYDVYLFEDTNYPLLFGVLFICVQPAIFEEVAFRGFMYSNLQKVTQPVSAIYITGFLFGIMHLSIISLLWLIPIGLVFAFLRMKYNTLWYGIVGHFVYNGTIVLIDFYDIGL